MYDAGIGRWGSRDPIGYDDGANIYAYVGNRANVAVDPRGLAADDKKRIISALTSGLQSIEQTDSDVATAYGIVKFRNTLVPFLKGKDGKHFVIDDSMNSAGKYYPSYSYLPSIELHIKSSLEFQVIGHEGVHFYHDAKGLYTEDEGWKSEQIAYTVEGMLTDARDFAGYVKKLKNFTVTDKMTSNGQCEKFQTEFTSLLSGIKNGYVWQLKSGAPVLPVDASFLPVVKSTLGLGTDCQTLKGIVQPLVDNIHTCCKLKCPQ